MSYFGRFDDNNSQFDDDRWPGPGLTLIAFSAEAGSPDDDALRLLASWAAAHAPADALATPNPA